MGWSGSHPQSATTKFRRVFGRSTCGGQSRPESAAAPPAGAASSARASRLPPPNLPESRGATTPPGGRQPRAAQRGASQPVARTSWSSRRSRAAADSIPWPAPLSGHRAASRRSRKHSVGSRSDGGRQILGALRVHACMVAYGRTRGDAIHARARDRTNVQELRCVDWWTRRRRSRS